jgi:hypothetical protein
MIYNHAKYILAAILVNVLMYAILMDIIIFLIISKNCDKSCKFLKLGLKGAVEICATNLANKNQVY